MGQTIEILDSVHIGDMLMLGTDRSFSGQDGESFSPPIRVHDQNTFPAQLAARLFDAGLGLDHVYVMSNTISLRRPEGWDGASREAATETVARFFRFYPENPPPGSG
ncbi:MAG: hypothetical protein ACT4OP_09540 [Actinomycetota bacterium]